MAIVSGKFENIQGVVTGDNYPVGSCTETTNMVPDGSGGLKERDPVYTTEVNNIFMLDENNGWNDIGTYKLNGDTIVRKTNIPSTIHGAYVNPKGGIVGISALLPMDIKKLVPKKVVWMEVQQTPSSGVYEFVFLVNNKRTTVNVDVHGPDTVTVPPVNMSDIPMTIGSGDTQRANPVYEATFNLRSAQRDALLLSNRTQATLDIQPNRLAANIVDRINRAIPEVRVTGRDTLLTVEHPVSIVAVSAPYWVKVVNSGRGQASDLPSHGRDGVTYELGGGLRYRYSDTDGWEEVAGTPVNTTPLYHLDGLSAGNPVSINLDPFDNSTLTLSSPVTVTQAGNRNMIHSPSATLISTTTDHTLYGQLSKNRLSAADGMVINKKTKNAFLYDTGVVITTEDGVEIRTFGSDTAETVHYGEVAVAFAYRSTAFVVSDDILEAKVKQNGSWVSNGELRLPIKPSEVFSTAEGIILSDTKSQYLFDGKNIYGPLVFNKSTPLKQGINRVSFYSNVQSHSWGSGDKSQENFDCTVIFRPPMVGKAFTPTSKYTVYQWTVNNVPESGVTIGSQYHDRLSGQRTFNHPNVTATHTINGSYDKLVGVILKKPVGSTKPFTVTAQSYKLNVWDNSQPSLWSQQ